MNEDWHTLKTFFPKNWQSLGRQTGAISRSLRGFNSADNLLRTLMIHLACGYSLRETVACADVSRLANISDVALLKRLRSCKKWFYEMCLALMEEQGIKIPLSGIKCRIFDATTVSEPGATGTLWRLHFSFQIPSFSCDFFDLTKSKGKGTGEIFTRFAINKYDYIIADRAYSNAIGIAHIHAHQAYVLVRLNSYSLNLYDKDGHKINLLLWLQDIQNTGEIKSRQVFVKSPSGVLIVGRLCALKKTEQATLLAQKQASKNSKKKNHKIKISTLEYAKYVLVFTTFPTKEFNDEEILEWYRLRWQIELIFKRLKSIINFDHLSKHDDASAIAWLYGKLFVALLTQKLVNCAKSLSPWGYNIQKKNYLQQLA
jgi:Transposase DDE domain